MRTFLIVAIALTLNHFGIMPDGIGFVGVIFLAIGGIMAVFQDFLEIKKEIKNS